MLEQLQQKRGLQMLPHRIQGVADRGCRGNVVHLYRGRIAQDLSGQAADLLRHGGGEQHGLSLGRQMLQDTADIRQKAHIKHLVCLIQHQQFQIGQVDRPLVDMIQQAAGTGHDNFHTLLQFFNLRIDINSAIHGDTLQPGLLPQFQYGIVDLLGQFTGWSNDQGPHLLARPLHQTVQDRQGKGSGLAGAGLGQSHDVMTVHDLGNCLGLNRGGCGVAHGSDSGNHLGV